MYGNVVREIGIYAKQASALFMAKTMNTAAMGNVFFNGPRAGINFNDNFGGGNLIFNNLIFNQCRETADHGPINSWDRIPYLLHAGTAKKNGKTKDEFYMPWQQKPQLITKNLIIANGNSMGAVDNDDGSGYFTVTDNYFPQSGGIKNDFGGRGKVFVNNLIVAYPRTGDSIYAGQSMECVGVEGVYTNSKFADVYTLNTCIRMAGADMLVADKNSTESQSDKSTKYSEKSQSAEVQTVSISSNAGCHTVTDPTTKKATSVFVQPKLAKNYYLSQSGKAKVNCGGESLDWETQFAELGGEVNSTIGVLTKGWEPQAIEYAEMLLGMKVGDGVYKRKSPSFAEFSRIIHVKNNDNIENHNSDTSSPRSDTSEESLVFA